jgi:hypothetical protein
LHFRNIAGVRHWAAGAALLSVVSLFDDHVILTTRCNSQSPFSSTSVTFPVSPLPGDSLPVKVGQGRPATEAVSGRRTAASGSGLYLAGIATTYHCKRLRPPTSSQRRSIARSHPGAIDSPELCLPSQSPACARIWLHVILSPPLDKHTLSFSLDSCLFLVRRIDAARFLISLATTCSLRGIECISMTSYWYQSRLVHTPPAPVLHPARCPSFSTSV